MIKKLLLILLLTVSGWSAQRSIYYNSKNAVTGDGSIDSPYKTLAAGNSTVAGYITAGDTVTAYLRDSSVFRGSWAVPTGGSSKLIIKRYGDLNKKPQINCGVIPTTWASYSSGAGQTWQFTIAQTVGKMWISDTVELSTGTDQNNLSDSTWYQTGGVLYIRLDIGNPASYNVEYSRLSQVLLLNGLSNLCFDGIDLRHSVAYAIRVSTSASNINFKNIDFDDNFAASVTVVSTTGLFESCKFIDCNGPSSMVVISGSSVLNFTLCHFKNSNYGVVTIAGGKNKFVNCNMDNFRLSAISSSSTDTTFVVNSLIHGSYPSTNYIIQSTNGPMIVDGSLVMSQGYKQPKEYWYNGNVKFNKIYKCDPKIVKTSREGYYSVSEDDRPNGPVFKKLGDYAKSVNQNYQFSWSVSEVHNLSGADSSVIKSVDIAGHDIVAHSCWHAYYEVGMGSMKLRYDGAADQCTVIVRNDSLLTFDGGVGSEPKFYIPWGIEYQIGHLIDSINTKTDWYAAPVEGLHIRSYANVIKNQTKIFQNGIIDSLELDTTKFFNFEVDSAKIFLEGVLGHEIYEFTYPQNLMSFDNPVIGRLKKAGFIGARKTTPSPLRMSDTFPLYGIPIYNDLCNENCVLMLDNNTNSSSAGTNFTGVNLTYNTVLQKDYDGCAVLNGSSYMYRNDTTFHYQSGDYTVGIWVRPTALNSINTVFYTGVNSDSCLTVYIDNNGAIHYVQRRGGNDAVHLTSSNNAIPIDEWTRLVFRQTIDTISVFTDTDIPAQNRKIVLFTSVVPDKYDGHTYFGCDFSTGSATNTFTGYFDKIDIAFDTWFNAIAIADQMAMAGCFGSSLTHGDFIGPRDIYKTGIDAWGTYTGRFGAIGLSQGLLNLRAKGVMSSDSLYCTWNQPDSADYRLRSDSKLAGAGDTSVLSGIPNLVNLSGDTITDSLGNLKVSSVNIGAYGTLNLDTPPSITTHPQNTSAILGDDATFTVSASGTTPFSYQWQENSSGWNAIGTDNSSLTISAVTSNLNGVYYRVVITNEFGTATSDSAMLTVLIPQIDSIRPSPWYRNRMVSIYGANFGISQGKDSVLIGGINGHRATLWTNTHITDTLPDTVGVFQIRVRGATESLRILRPRSR